MQWRDTSPLTRLWFYGSAIKEMGRPRLYSLHLTKPTRRQMKRSKLAAKDFIARRFRDYLPDIPYFFVLEHSDNGTLHLHGAVSASDVSPYELRNLLRKVAGDPRKLTIEKDKFFHRCKAVRVKAPDQQKNFGGRNGMFGWTTYCEKDTVKTQRRLGCSPISCSRDVSQRARQIHDEVVNWTPDVSLMLPDVSPPETMS
ncbi:MAG: hypothetical protein HY985_02280 [Magnetospirillum sp.]|nr:hypothetical protein [Magnetospirillum sp.]